VIVGIEINYSLSNFFYLLLLFAMLTCGHRVQYGNIVVQQPLSANHIISAACISVVVVHICNKVVDSVYFQLHVAFIILLTKNYEHIFNFVRVSNHNSVIFFTSDTIKTAFLMTS